MIAPAAKCDLDIARSQIRADQVARDKRRITESGITVAVALLVRKTERPVNTGVVHHLAGAGIEILHLVKVGATNSAGLECLEQRIATREKIFTVRVRKIRQSIVSCGHIEGRKAPGQVTLANETPRAVQRNKRR